MRATTHRFVAGTAVVIILTLVVHTAVAASPAPTEISTRGAVEAIALDGWRLAYDLQAVGGCNTVRVRDLRAGRDTVVSGRRTCAADSTSTGAGVRELAIAGRRVAWIVNLGGNTESVDTLYTATTGGPGEHLVASARRLGDVGGDLTGSWLGHLVGGGDVIAVNRWTTESGRVVASSLRRLDPGLRVVHAGDGALAASAADAGLIAVLQEDGDVVLRTADGSTLRSFAPAAPARELALADGSVVALEPGRLELLRAADGRSLGQLPIPAAARSLDAHDGLATFAVARHVYAVDLVTGRTAMLVRAPRSIVATRIDASGVVYAFNRSTGVGGRGTIVVVPLAQVRAALR